MTREGRPAPGAAERGAADRAGRAAQLFEAWTGRAPDGVWRAPGRVNLIGEHLDYNGGHVLPFAIDRSAWVAARPNRRRVLCLRSTAYPGDVEVPLTGLASASGWAAYVAGVVWALGPSVEPFGADLLVDSDVPAGAGLSSSAAVECAVALAVADLADQPTASTADRTRLAASAQKAEAAVAGAPVGIMDQMASLLARAGHVTHLDTVELSVEHLPLDLDGAALTLLAVDTGHPHALSDGGYAERRRECEVAAAALGVRHLAAARLDDLERADLGPPLAGRARHVITEEARVAAVASDLRAVAAGGRLPGRRLGAALTASHRSMQHDFDNSAPVVDAAVDAALAAGALGARMTGGGWGGTVIVLTERSTAAVTGAAAAAAVAAATGRRAAVFEVRPGPGAERVL